MVKGKSETTDLYPNYLKTFCLMVTKLATRVGDPYCVLGHSVKVKLLVFISSVIQTIIQEPFVWKLTKLETTVATRKWIIIFDFQVLCSKSRSILNLEKWNVPLIGLYTLYGKLQNLLEEKANRNLLLFNLLWTYCMYLHENRFKSNQRVKNPYLTSHIQMSRYFFCLKTHWFLPDI